MKSIAVVGSINIDTTVYMDKFPKKGETRIGDFSSTSLGGKGCNQAIAISNAKGNVCFYGSVGDDDKANIAKNYINSFGLNAELHVCGKAETGSATILVESTGENRIVVLKGANEFVNKDTLPNSVFNKDIIVLQNEIPSETISLLTNAYKDRIVVFNPAPTKEIDESVFGNITYLILNEGELAFYGKNKGEPIDYLLSLGVKNIIVTLGKRGSTLYSKCGTTHVDASKAVAIDTVAAGDTYIGYFTAMIAEGKNNKEAMEIASLASGIAVTRRGAAISIPKLEEVIK